MLIGRDALEKRSTLSGVKANAVNIFRGVSFDDWLRLFMQVGCPLVRKFEVCAENLQYCFNVTRRGQYDTADEILRHIIVSNAYQARERQDSIRLALISKAFPSVSI